VFSLFNAIVNEKYRWGTYTNDNLPYIHFRDIMAFIFYPLKDFFIAISFTGITFFQGKSVKKGSKGMVKLGLQRMSGGLNESTHKDI
jgi:hypothetical protein